MFRALAELSIFEWIGHVSYLLNTLAFMVRDMLYLRLLALFSGLLFVTYAIGGTSDVLYVDLFWEGLLMAINIYNLIVLFNERKVPTLTPLQQQVYDKIFFHMTKKNFLKLFSIAKTPVLKPDTIITTENTPVRMITFVVQGNVRIEAQGKEVGCFSSNILIGEMSFITGEKASATVTVQSHTQVVQWDQDILRTMLTKYPEIEQGVQTVFNKNFVKKLLSINSYRNEN